MILDPAGGGPGRLEPFYHGFGVSQPLQQLRGGTRLGDGKFLLLRVGAKAENSEIARFVDVGNGRHGRLQDDL